VINKIFSKNVKEEFFFDKIFFCPRNEKRKNLSKIFLNSEKFFKENSTPEQKTFSLSTTKTLSKDRIEGISSLLNSRQATNLI